MDLVTTICLEKDTEKSEGYVVFCTQIKCVCVHLTKSGVLT